MTHLEQLIQDLCPNGVKRYKLKEIAELKRGVVISKDYINEHAGEYPVYSSQTENNGCLGYIDTYAYDGTYLTWTTDGANAGTVFYREGKFNITNVCGLVIVTNPQISVKYLYYILSITAPKYVNRGMGNPKLMSNVMQELQIPLPPLAVQSEIVRILDEFTLYKSELAAELAARLQQYEYYRDQLLTFDDTVKRVTTNEIFDVITDYTAAGSFADLAKNVKYEKENGFAQLIRTTDLKSKFAKKDSFIYVNEHAYEYLWRVQLDKESIIMPNVGNCGEVYYTLPNIFPSEFNVLGPNAILIRSNKYLNKYLYYAIQHEDFQKQLKKITSPVGQTKFNKTEFKKLLIPLPPLSEQERIASILDRFDKLCHDIREGLPAEIDLRQKQYEHYRDRLLTFEAAK